MPHHRSPAALALSACLALAACADPAPTWQPLAPRLPTRWSAEVSVDAPLPEYPRPQQVRERWLNLNGVWEYELLAAEAEVPLGRALPERIRVPFAVGADLSGIGRRDERMAYRRALTLPEGWGEGERLLLHFGAVDYHSRVWVDGVLVGEHVGGYDAFSFDITDALDPARREHELVVAVEDYTDAAWQPIGKQTVTPGNIFYEPVSGIWQTVWLEPVPEAYIAQLVPTPELSAEAVHLEVTTAGASAEGLRLEALVSVDGALVAQAAGPAGAPLSVSLPDARLWSPDDPHLYDLELRLLDGERELDCVASYFGMREVGLAEGLDGRLRVTLNGVPTFLMSTLDQGYWPDGLYTAPTDEALRFDLEQTKALGFNTVRKHIKVEPARWYYWADRLGLLVWQDMPNLRSRLTPAGLRGPLADAEAQAAYERQLLAMVGQLRHATSVIGWVIMNEGWGEWSSEGTGALADRVALADPSRLINASSGVNCCFSKLDSGRGDIIDWHTYVGPAIPTPDATRAAIDGEHGGFGLLVPEHVWGGASFAYQAVEDAEALTDAYVANQSALLTLGPACALSGAVYTQITDVEAEINGLLTYDRELVKVDVARVAEINRAVIAANSGPDVGLDADPSLCVAP